MTDLSLLQDFVTETVEHLEEMEGNLLQLETDPGNRDLLNDIFRSVHTIKGASEYLGMERIAELSHKLENLLDLMRHNKRSASREILDLLMEARDRIGILTADLHQSQSEQAEIDDLLIRIRSLSSETTAALTEGPTSTDSAPSPPTLSGDVAQSDIYEEEHDEELFGIFLEQLQEGLEALQSWTGALPDADATDQIEILGRCQEQLDPLRSSANYMGYGKLTTLYDRWDDAIQAARERLDRGENQFLPTFIAESMHANIGEIKAAFPRLNLTIAASPEVAADPEADSEDFMGAGLEPKSIGAHPGDAEFHAGEMDDSDLSTEFEAIDETGELKLFREDDFVDDDFDPVGQKEGALDLALMQDFITETVEHLGEMEDNLLRLETDPDNRDVLNDIFRSVHTIKGAAEYMGMVRIAELSHKLESLLDLLRHKECSVNRDIIDLLMATRDRIGLLTADLHQTQTEQADIHDLLERIQSLGVESPNGPVSEKPVLDTAEDPNEIPEGLLTDAPEGDIYDEEHDEELFGIFLEQLQEGLDALQSWTYALSSADQPDRIEILRRCLVHIDPLRSSANYMGYRKLTLLYDRWIEAIRTARERLETKDAQFMPAFIAGCMQSTVDDIRRCFPRLEAATDASQSTVAGQGSIETPAIAGGAESPVASDLLDAYAKTPVPELVSDGATLQAIPVADSGSLFDRLSQSLDRRLAENQTPESGAAPSGLAVELFSDGQPADDSLSPSAWTENRGFNDDDPLAAYVAAPDTSTPEGATELSGAESAVARLAQNAISEVMVTEPEPLEEKTLVEPIEWDFTAAEAASEQASLGDAETESTVEDATDDRSVLQVPPKVDSDEEMAAAFDAQQSRMRSEKTVEDTPAESASPQEAAIAEPEQRMGNRRDPVSRGRRKSDRISEQLLKQSIRVDAGKIDDLMNQVGELVVSRAWFSQLFHEMRDLQQNLQHRASLEAREMKQVKGLTFRLSEATVALGRVANELQEGVMKVRMLPIAQLFNRYPRLVFDLVRDGDKKVNLDITGEETELDKMVIEAISDPLIHIIRNAVDHGIETTELRRQLGKPEIGTIHLEAYHEGNHVVIEIADDGQGLDIDRIKTKAMAGNFASQTEIERMPMKELTGLIMQPGFSTAAEVTHTSGRGVGMDVVKQNIEKLNGTIEIDSIPGVETRFRIKIPLTLAIIPALLVQVRGELFTIPLSTVEETIRIAPENLSTIEGVEVLQLRESTLPLVRLAELFNMPAASTVDGRAFVVVVSTGMKRVGLVVDALMGQEEVVIKPLEDYLQEKSGFSGATILGDGRISLILDIYELVNLSIDRQAQRKRVTRPYSRPEIPVSPAGIAE